MMIIAYHKHIIDLDLPLPIQGSSRDHPEVLRLPGLQWPLHGHADVPQRPLVCSVVVPDAQVAEPREVLQPQEIRLKTRAIGCRRAGSTQSGGENELYMLYMEIS